MKVSPSELVHYPEVMRAWGVTENFQTTINRNKPLKLYIIHIGDNIIRRQKSHDL